MRAPATCLREAPDTVCGACHAGRHLELGSGIRARPTPFHLTRESLSERALNRFANREVVS